jgi:hypothetical protein
MAQHFLLSAAARTLTIREIYKAGEDAAYETFVNRRAKLTPYRRPKLTPPALW